MLPADAQVLFLAALYVAGATLTFAGNRTALHVAMGNLAWFALLLQEPAWGFAGASALAALAAWAYWRPPALYLQVMGGERDAGPLAFFAAMAAMTGLWLLFALPAWWIVAAYLCMAFADPVGFYAGKAWGRRRLGNGKSLEGMAAVFAACVPVAVAMEVLFAADVPAGVLLGRAVLVSGGAAAGEALAPRHGDNLLMPLGALAALALGRGVLPG